MALLVTIWKSTSMENHTTVCPSISDHRENDDISTNVLVAWNGLHAYPWEGLFLALMLEGRVENE